MTDAIDAAVERIATALRAVADELVRHESKAKWLGDTYPDHVMRSVYLTMGEMRALARAQPADWSPIPEDTAAYDRGHADGVKVGRVLAQPSAPEPVVPIEQRGEGPTVWDECLSSGGVAGTRVLCPVCAEYSDQCRCAPPAPECIGKHESEHDPCPAHPRKQPAPEPSVDAIGCAKHDALVCEPCAYDRGFAAASALKPSASWSGSTRSAL